MRRKVEDMFKERDEIEVRLLPTLKYPYYTAEFYKKIDIFLHMLVFIQSNNTFRCYAKYSKRFQEIMLYVDIGENANCVEGTQQMYAEFPYEIFLENFEEVK